MSKRTLTQVFLFEAAALGVVFFFLLRIIKVKA